jgi:multiple sugar transport system permease protein
MAAPALGILALVVAIPLGVAVYQSLTDSSLTKVGPTEFVGTENYTDRVATPEFGQAVFVTAAIMALSLAVQLPIGYWLALALSRPARASRIMRTVITLPMMLTPVAVGLMWRFLADPGLGVIRLVASWFDPDAMPNALGSEFGALMLVVLINSWINIPLVTILLLAGMMGISEELYEAGRIDGANRWQLRWHVTIPGIAPVIAVASVLRLAGDYRMFDLVYTVTRGGPGSATRNLSMLAYQEALVNYNTGRASAMAVTMALLAVPAYVLYRRVTKL